MIRSRRYDLVIPMGQSCACTQALRVAKLQWLSLPFDWVGGPTWVEQIRIIENGFSDWMHPNAFLHIGDRRHPQGRIYRNIETELIYSHEVPLGGSWEMSRKEIEKKYERRVKRFGALLKRAKNILAVRIAVPGLPMESDEQLRECQRRFAALCNNATVELLYFVNRNGMHIARERSVGMHIKVVELDYADKESAKPNPLVPDLTALEQYLSRYVCKDYRTKKEKHSCNAHKDYRHLFGISEPLPEPPNKVWNFGEKAFELTPLRFSVAFRENNRYRAELDHAIRTVLDDATYYNGRARNSFERNFANFVGAKQVIAFATYEDALRMAARMVGVSYAEARENIISIVNGFSVPSQTIVPKRHGVRGAIVDLSASIVKDVCRTYLPSHGAVAVFHFEEESNLHALGNIACVASFESHIPHCQEVYADELQCALMMVKLSHLSQDNKRRSEIAKWYFDNAKSCIVRLADEGTASVWTFVPIKINERFVIPVRLRRLGVAIKGDTLLLPTSPGLSNAEVVEIIETLKRKGII